MIRCKSSSVAVISILFLHFVHPFDADDVDLDSIRREVNQPLFIHYPSYYYEIPSQFFHDSRSRRPLSGIYHNAERKLPMTLWWWLPQFADSIQIESVYSSSVVINVPGYAQRLKGTTTEKSFFTGRPYYAFRSVYYAEKPTNLTRFLPPIPKASFPGDQIVDATTDNAGCPQPKGVEDCLSLNIFTPRLPIYGGFHLRPLPVMFWIHGGGNSGGRASDYIPDKYMEEDIVLVVIQYRLGPLGWLSLSTDDVPGNAAAFDMIEALRWVQKHIGAFGGDRDRVTIAGESAGSKNVMLLLLAPQAKGLFHRAIAESGNILPRHAYQTSDEATAASMTIAQSAGCSSTSYKALLSCLRNIDPATLSSAYFSYARDQQRNYFNLGGAGSSPVIQTAGAQRIIQEEPLELFRSGRYSKVPLMIGTNKHEGSYMLAAIYLQNLVPNKRITNSSYLTNELVPDILELFAVSDNNGQLASSYASKYLAGAQLGNFTSMTPGLIDICSVAWLKATTLDTAEILTRQGSDGVYLYSFEFQGSSSYFDKVFFPPPITPPIAHGVSHADELIYSFSNSVFAPLNETELAFSKQMIQVWTNFIKHGKPTPWYYSLFHAEEIPYFPRYSLKSKKYMVMDQNYWHVNTDYVNTFKTTTN